MIEEAEIYSELTGIVAMLYVEDGSQVEMGEKILGIECMKMIQDVFAPLPGIFRLKKQLGETVSEQEVVAIIEI